MIPIIHQFREKLFQEFQYFINFMVKFALCLYVLFIVFTRIVKCHIWINTKLINVRTITPRRDSYFESIFTLTISGTGYYFFLWQLGDGSINSCKFPKKYFVTNSTSNSFETLYFSACYTLLSLLGESNW